MALDRILHHGQPLRTEAEVIWDRLASRQLRRVCCDGCVHWTDGPDGGFCHALDQPRHGREDRCSDDFKARDGR